MTGKPFYTLLRFLVLFLLAMFQSQGLTAAGKPLLFNIIENKTGTELRYYLKQGTNATLMPLENSGFMSSGHQPAEVIIPLQNTSSDTVVRLITFEDPPLILPDISFSAQLLTNNSWQIVPFISRHWHENLFTLEVKVPPSARMMVKLGFQEFAAPFYAGFTLHQPASYSAAEDRMLHSYSFIFGIWMVILAFSLVLLGLLKEKVYLYYSLYVALLWLFLLQDTGLSYVLFPKFHEIPAAILAYATSPFSLAFYMLLFYHGIRPNYRVFSRRFKLWYRILIISNFTAGGPEVAAAIFMPASLLKGLHEISQNYLLYISSLTLFYFVVKAAVKGYRQAWAFLGCILLIGTATLIYNLYQLNILEKHILYPDEITIALTGEMIAMFVIILFRLEAIRRDQITLKSQLQQKELQAHKHILEAIEGERRRIAQDLHDEVGGSLSALNLKLYHADDALPEENIKSRKLLNEAWQYTHQIIKKVRSISRNTYPPDLYMLGLEDFIKKHLESLNQSEETRFSYSFRQPFPLLPEEHQLQLYRILLELLNNVIRHARAHNCHLEVQVRQHTLLLLIADDGTGFNPEAQTEGMGMRSIRHRLAILGGSMQINSSSEGTIIHLEVSIPAEIESSQPQRV